MSIDLRLPSINGATPEEQIAQMRSYMYQLVGQLNWALDSIANGTVADNTSSELDIAAKSVNEKEANTQDAVNTFNRIKSLIIKSADIVNSYEEQMQVDFDGRYVAESDYGVFKEETESSITANSQDITQLYSNTQTITNDNEVTTIHKANAYIKTGLLDSDDQIYGVEVGENRVIDGEETSGYARFTHNGIYFYLPNVEEPVAFFKDFFMQVQAARFPDSIAIRGYSLDTKLGGIAFKWTGEQ